MSIPIPIFLKCPCCKQTFEDEFGALASLSGGGFYPDFKTGFAPGHSLTELLLYSCDHCGFTERTVLEWFEKTLSKELNSFIKSSLKRLYRDRTPSQDATPGRYSKFERYAIIQEYRGACAFDIGECYLRASWTNKSNRCRAIALQKFQQAIKETKVTFEEEVPLATYLAAEIARKLGEYDIAQKLFGSVRRLAKVQPEFELLSKMTEIQSTNPIEEPHWDFKDQFILDPLSYYHCAVLLSSAERIKIANSKKAFYLFKRTYDICEPALERYVSLKIPNLSGAGGLRGSLSELFKKNANEGGFWVDNHLIGIGLQALKSLYDLRHDTDCSANEREQIELTIHRVTASLQRIKREKQTRDAKKKK